MANELLASVDDINAHLPPDKAQITDADDDLLQTEAFRLVRAKLAGTFPIATLATWDSPTDTPEIIRTIAGMIIAAKWYAELYAEDSDEDAEYARNLWDQAMLLLQQIIDGLLVVIGVDQNPIPGTTMLSSISFFPNDSVEPKFTMDKELA